MDFRVGDYTLEYFLLAIALMMILSILSSKASSWLGVPSLLLFLGVGMIAGSEGPGGIEFDNYSMAFVIGSVSLVFILFGGGMGTNWRLVRPVVGIGVSLASFGVFFTCLFIGTFCHFVFSLSWPESLLLGAIVSSTDAAAVFSIFRSKNLALRGSLKELLEFEAGSNDPTAIFLTMAFLQLVLNPEQGLIEFMTLFFSQSIIGVLMGLVGGKLAVWLFNKIKVDYDGLYIVFLVALILLIFSATTIFFGSGFLAVYVAGLVIGNSNLMRKQSLVIFQDGMAWIAQITLFIVLGLLVVPSHLLSVWREGVILAIFMMFLARPLSVLFAMPKSPFDSKERLFISWVGLRGAAPIILAIFPWAQGYEHAEHLFNLVFFVVIFSVFIQGPSIPWLANKLGISEEAVNEEEATTTFLPKGFVAMDFLVTNTGAALGLRTIDLKLPNGVLLISLERNEQYSVPRGDTIFEVDDKVTALGRASNVATLKEIFGQCLEVELPGRI